MLLIGQIINQRRDEMKKYIVWVSIVAVCIALFSCQSTLRHRHLLSQAAAPDEFSTTLPISIRKGLIVIDVEVGQTPLVMLLDSGAFESKIETSKARELNLKTILSRNNSDTFGRRREISITSIDAIKIGDVPFNQISAGILTYPEKALTPCVAPDGIIGGNLLKLTNWKLDYLKQELTLFSQHARPATAKHDSVIELDMSISRLSAVPKIDIRINNTLIEDVMVDLGFNGGLILPIDSVPINTRDKRFVIDGARSGIYGLTTTQGYVADVELQISDSSSLLVEAEFTPNSQPKIGNQILSHFIVTADNTNQKLYLTPNTQPDSLRYSALRHGYLFGIDEETDRWKVSYIEKYSHQTQALQFDQRFNTINSKKPSEVFSSHCDWFLGIREFVDQPHLTLESEEGTLIEL